MKRLLVALGLTGCLLVGLSLSPPGFAAAPQAGTEGKPTQGVQITNVTRTPKGFSTALVTQGREVYADLQAASAAVRHRDALALRVALHDAQAKLQFLGSRGEERALEAQMEIIRADLEDQTKPPDVTLWVPVEAELDRVLIGAPPPVKSAASQAVEAGKAAAEKGDRKTAKQRLDVLVDAVEFKLGAFPLAKVRQDVQSAARSAALPTPDWKAAQEATRSALAQMHWVTRVNSEGLLAAYYAIADAQALWKEGRRPAAVRDLTKMADELAKLPNGNALAARARQVALAPNVQAMNDLRSAVLRQVQAVQAEAAKQYLAAEGGGT
jgi:YfdX protein